MSVDEPRRWCLFTSAGERSAIRLWLAGDTLRRWDLVVAYYGEDSNEYAEISKFCSFAFRTKGSKFQNLKRLITENPGFFDQSLCEGRQPQPMTFQMAAVAVARQMSREKRASHPAAAVASRA
jgi:hypothetical protein